MNIFKKNINNKINFFLIKNKYFILICKIISFLFVIFIFIIILLIITFYLAYKGYFGVMPNIENLDNPNKFVPSEIISCDGVVLDKFEKTKIIPVEYKDLPIFLIQALLAKEDKRFFYHSGIDFESIFRVLYYRGNKGGGSTLTQQLAKMLFTIQSQEKIEEQINPKSQTWFEKRREFQKIREWIISIELEKRYTKKEIICMYLNKFDYLNNAVGITMAAKIYYQKNVKQLNLQECATLVGMFENPNRYNPVFNTKNAKSQCDLILKLMKQQGKISNNEYYKYIKKSINTKFKKNKKIYQHFSVYFKHQLKKDVLTSLNEYEKQFGKKYNLYKDGLKIYVTIDSRMQKYAEEAIKEHLIKLQHSFFLYIKNKKNIAPFSDISLKKANKLFNIAMKRTQRYKLYKNQNLSEKEIINKFKQPIHLEVFTWNGSKDTLMSPWDSIRYHKHIINSGLMTIDAETGNIKTWVGGIDWNYFKYDHVKQAKRQVGSIFKPFSYAALIINNGYTPCTIISNFVPKSLGWFPKGTGTSITTIKNAIAKSLNGCAINAMNIAGINNTIKLCKNLGIENNIEANLSSALGSSDLTIYEMVGAYSTFANYGTYIRPEMIWRIENANGQIIKEYNPKKKSVINEIHAYLIIESMKGVTLNGGTGKLASTYIKTEIVGKTGTTNNNSDAWFIGMTPRLVCGVWVGWEDRDTHFNNNIGQGAKAALPIWGRFMQKVYHDKKLGYFVHKKFIPPILFKDKFNCNLLKMINLNHNNVEEVDDINYDEEFNNLNLFIDSQKNKKLDINNLNIQ